MPFVPESQRLDALRLLCLSEPLIHQSAGKQVHPLLWSRCEGPPYKPYHGAHCPVGPSLVPLWECGDCVTGVWQKVDGSLEFIEFSVEAPEEYTVLATTEQGLWATVFADLFEDNDDMELAGFEESARAVGFRFVNRLVISDEGFEGREAWRRRVVESIDREAGTKP